MKLYDIEMSMGYYHFMSLYNGMTGTKFETKKEAIAQGEAHQKIICALHPELNALVNEEVIKCDVKPSDVYAIKDKKLFAHIVVKSEDINNAQGYIFISTPYKTVASTSLEEMELAKVNFKPIWEIVELIKSGEWIKCENVKEELKTI